MTRTKALQRNHSVGNILPLSRPLALAMRLSQRPPVLAHRTLLWRGEGLQGGRFQDFGNLATSHSSKIGPKGSSACRAVQPNRRHRCRLANCNSGLEMPLNHLLPRTTKIRAMA